LDLSTRASPRGIRPSTDKRTNLIALAPAS
jgi:hypothetical protein